MNILTEQFNGQSVEQSVEQSIEQLVEQLVEQSVEQSVEYSTEHSTEHSIKQSIELKYFNKCIPNPKDEPYPHCGGIIVLNADLTKCLLVHSPKKHPKQTFENYSWTKGSRERHENLFDVAFRETTEESGIKPEQLSIIDNLYMIEMTKSKINIGYLVGVYTGSNDQKLTFDPSELSDVGFKLFDEAQQLLMEIRKNILNDLIAHIKSSELTYVNGQKLLDWVQTLNLKKPKNKFKSVHNKSVNKQTESKKKYIYDPIKALSKKLSWILRHHMDDLGLKYNSAGYVKIDDLLALNDLKSVTYDQINEVVEKNDKQRFHIKYYTNYEILKDELWIRANQGHSTKFDLTIDENQIYKKLTEPFDKCIHGTTYEALKQIINDGLKPMGRTHIHFAIDVPNQSIQSVTSQLESNQSSKLKLLSGIRSNAKVLIYINMAKAMIDGCEFFMSENNVILSQGFNGTIDMNYFEKIVFV